MRLWQQATLTVKPDWKMSAASVPLNLASLLLELEVDVHRADDRAGRRPCPRRTESMAALAAALSFGMVGQVEVVVGGQVDDVLAVHDADRLLRPVHHAQLRRSALPP